MKAAIKRDLIHIAQLKMKKIIRYNATLVISVPIPNKMTKVGENSS